MNYAALKHVNFAHSATNADASTPSVRFKPRSRLITRSPDEEWEARLEKQTTPEGVSPIEALPDALAALIMQTQQTLKVTRNGIKITILGKDYVYWHESSATCNPSMMGQKVLVTYDPDNLAFIHIIAGDGRYVETIPLKTDKAWYSEEAWKDVAANKRVAQAVHDRLKLLHGPTSRKIADRARHNAETLQSVHTFPHPRTVGASSNPENERLAGEDPAPAPDTLSNTRSRGGEFPLAERIAYEHSQALDAHERFQSNQTNALQEAIAGNRSLEDLIPEADESITDIETETEHEASAPVDAMKGLRELMEPIDQ